MKVTASWENPDKSTVSWDVFDLLEWELFNLWCIACILVVKFRQGRHHLILATLSLCLRNGRVNFQAQ